MGWGPVSWTGSNTAAVLVSSIIAAHVISPCIAIARLRCAFALSDHVVVARDVSGHGASKTCVLAEITPATDPKLTSRTGPSVADAIDTPLAGVSAMADGRIVVTGGNTDSATSLFSPSSMTWSKGPRMNIARGYQVLMDTILTPSLTTRGHSILMLTARPVRSEHEASQHHFPTAGCVVSVCLIPPTTAESDYSSMGP